MHTSLGVLEFNNRWCEHTVVAINNVWKCWTSTLPTTMVLSRRHALALSRPQYMEQIN